MKNTTVAHAEQPTDAFISASALAEHLSIPPSCLRELADENSVPPIVAQGEIRFIPADVTAWLNDHRVEASGPSAGR